MTKRMLIDATQPEETRVVLVDGDQLVDFDFESSTKKQLKGNVYLAKVTRVEPSLQAAFVEYGGNRHGFLAFSEIHPDYYQIPQADRALLESLERDVAQNQGDDHPDEANANVDGPGDPASSERPDDEADDNCDAEADAISEADENGDVGAEARGGNGKADTGQDDTGDDQAEDASSDEESDDGDYDDESDPQPVIPPEAFNEDSDHDADELRGEQARRRARLLRSYKIQEVIKRRQILLVQVVKEERGNKGAALTTYLSLAGRYCVLMPNTPRGGGISRKITNATDRNRLKTIIKGLDVPEGIGLIVRTAGAQRNKSEIKRDYDYLLRQWSEIRDTTLESVAPDLIYEEGDLIKRAMRDLYTRDIEEVLVDGEEGYRSGKRLMQMMMPSHARKVKLYKDDLPLFYRYRIEDQLDGMHSPTVMLPSGGSIVIHTTEALTAVDVNSGRSTRERHIDETALKTNVEAAEEVARQMRLRDLAGLIVIDFIDMAENRHQRQVERRLREALKLDRARLQVGRISMFGLLELSRQRLRASLLELSSQPCPVCSGLGVVRSTESCALHALRTVQEEGIKNEARVVQLSLPSDVALYVLNQKREALLRLEARHEMKVLVTVDRDLLPSELRLDVVERREGQLAEDDEEDRRPRGRKRERSEGGERPRRGRRAEARDEPKEQPRDQQREDERAADSEDDDGSRKRRRRRRRRRRDEDGDVAAEKPNSSSAASGPDDNTGTDEDREGVESGTGRSGPSGADADTRDDEGGRRRRRRRRRGRNENSEETTGPQTEPQVGGRESTAEDNNEPEVSPPAPAAESTPPVDEAAVLLAKLHRMVTLSPPPTMPTATGGEPGDDPQPSVANGDNVPVVEPDDAAESSSEEHAAPGASEGLEVEASAEAASPDPVSGDTAAADERDREEGVAGEASEPDQAIHPDAVPVAQAPILEEEADSPVMRPFVGADAHIEGDDSADVDEPQDRSSDGDGTGGASAGEGAFVHPNARQAETEGDTAQIDAEAPMVASGLSEAEHKDTGAPNEDDGEPQEERRGWWSRWVK